jgi:hypothetical protein
MRRISTSFIISPALISYFWVTILFPLTERANAQAVACPSVNAGSDVTLNCASACTTLTATYTAVGSTSSYSVSNITYAPVAAYNTGTPIIIGVDDLWSPLLPLPFPFCFFGTTYNYAVAGSNEILTFDATAPGGWCEWDLTWGLPIPTTFYGLGTYPAIMGPYQDIDPTYQGLIAWSVIGSTPCRKFVLNYYNVPYYGDPNSVAPFFCNGALYATSQIVLYETTNIIDIYIQSKPYCTNWNNGLAIEGIQNATGTVAYAVPGRNNTVFSVTNDAKRFTPNAAPSQVSLTWYDGNNNLIGSGASISVCPSATTTYTVYAHYGNCPGGTTADASDQVVVTVPTVLAASPTVTNAPCTGTTGSGSVSASGGSPGYTYSWTPSGGTGTSASNLSPGTYTIRVTDSHGCSVTSIVTVATSSNPTASSVVTTSLCPTSNQTVLTSYTGNTYTDVTVCASNPSGWLTNNQVCTDPGNADCTAHFVKDSLIAPYSIMGGALTAASIQSVYVSLDTIVGTNSRGCGYDNRLWLRSPGGNLYLLAAQKSANSASTNKYKPTFTVAGTLGILPNAAGSYNLMGYRPDQGSLTAAPWVGEYPGATWAGNANENYTHTAGQWQVYTNDQIGGGGCNGNGNITKITEFCITFRTYPTLSYNWTVGASSTGACSTYVSSTTIADPVLVPPVSGAYNCTYNLLITDGNGCTSTSSVNINCNALPVELLGFTGRNTVFGNKLEWRTSSEINNHYFTIQRSTDGISFANDMTIESLADNGNSNHTLYYTITDRDVKPGLYYYRLNQTDLDGQIKDIGTILVPVKSDRDVFNVKPNPATGVAELTYECLSDEKAFLKVYDDHGTLVMTKEFVCRKGENTMTLDLSGNAEGIYLISVSTTENIYKTRLVLSRGK